MCLAVHPARKLMLALTLATTLLIPVVAWAEVHDAHGPAAGGAKLPQMEVSTFIGQVFWLSILFVGFFAFVKNFVIPRIGGALEQRANLIESELSAARAAKLSSESLQAEYEKTRSQAYAQSARMMIEAEEQARAKAAQALADFRERAAKMIAQTESELTEARDRAMPNIAPIAAELASLAAQKIVGIPADLDQARSVVQTLNQKKAA
jgi:F-type H+-transporting ATPase subunit b